jgi:hypothetical protein
VARDTTGSTLEETLDAMLFADQLLSNPHRCFRLNHLVLLLLFLLICWTGVTSAWSRRICTSCRFRGSGSPTSAPPTPKSIPVLRRHGRSPASTPCTRRRLLARLRSRAAVGHRAAVAHVRSCTAREPLLCRRHACLLPRPHA